MSSHRELTRQVRALRQYLTAHKAAVGTAFSRSTGSGEGAIADVPQEMRDVMRGLYTRAVQLEKGCIALLREHGKA